MSCFSAGFGVQDISCLGLAFEKPQGAEKRLRHWSLSRRELCRINHLAVRHRDLTDNLHQILCSCFSHGAHLPEKKGSRCSLDCTFFLRVDSDVTRRVDFCGFRSYAFAPSFGAYPTSTPRTCQNILCRLNPSISSSTLLHSSRTWNAWVQDLGLAPGNV